VKEDEEKVSRWHASTFFSNVAASRDSKVGSEIMKVEEDFGEEFGSAKDIYKDEPILDYFKSKTVEGTFSVKKREIESFNEQNCSSERGFSCHKRCKMGENS